MIITVLRAALEFKMHRTANNIPIPDIINVIKSE